MRCEYCDVEVTQYPEDGLCICCGGRLPPKPVAPPIPATQRQFFLVPGVNCCPKCRSTAIVFEKRGFSWGLGILGCVLIPVLGIFLGFCGSRGVRIRCTGCRHKWKRP